MKTLKTLLSVFAIAAVFSAGAFAQQNVDVNVNATVLGSLSLTKQTDLNFGNITATAVAQTITVDNGATGDQTQGKIDVSATPGSFINFTFGSGTVQLSNGTENMNFTPAVTGNTTDNAGTASSISGDGATAVQVATSGSTTYYIYVGGDLEVAASQAEGFYTATYNVEVDYNN